MSRRLPAVSEQREAMAMLEQLRARPFFAHMISVRLKLHVMPRKSGRRLSDNARRPLFEKRSLPTRFARQHRRGGMPPWR